MAWTLAQYQAALKAATDESARLNSLTTSTKQESSSTKAAADAAATKAAETKKIVDTAGYNLKWTQKTAAENAAKANTLAQQQSQQAAAQAAETKALKRKAEYDVVAKQYDLKLASNPNVLTKLNPRSGSKPYNYKALYQANEKHRDYNKKIAQENKDAKKEVRVKHLKADGWSPAPIPFGFLYGDAGKKLADIKQGKGYNYRNIDATSSYQVDVVLANRAVEYGEITPEQGVKEVEKAKAKYGKYKDWQSAQFSKTAQTNSASQLAKDKKKWQSVINNPATYQNQLTGNKIMNVKEAPVNESRINDPLNNEYSVDGTAVSAQEKNTITDIVKRQRAQEEINREQQKLFNAMRNAPNAAAALKLKGAAMAQNPNVGTFNALFYGNKLQSTSGVFGIGDGTVKDLNYNKFDRATQSFAENPKLGNLTDSQGNIIASNLKSSSGSEWNFSPVPQQTAKKESEPTIAQGIAVPPTAAGFLGGLSLFAQSPSPSSGTVSTQASVPSYDFRLTNYNDNLEIFETKWDGVEEFTSQEQADEYAADFDALNFQYENLSDEFEIQQKEDEEWGGYMPEDQGWYSYVQNEIRPKDVPRNELGNVNDPVTGSVVKVGWNVVAAINNLGVWGSKTIDPKTYKNEEYMKYYSTPVTNVESAGFGAVLGTATQGTEFWTGGYGNQLIDNEKNQIGKNFERNPQEAILTTIMEGAFYPITGTANLIRKGAVKLGGLLGDTAESTAKGAAKGAASVTPTAPTSKFTPAEIAQAKKDWSDIQQGITTPTQKSQEKILKILQSGDAKKPYPKDPTPSELKLYDDIINTKIKKVPDVKVPTIFKNVGKVADDLPIIKTNDLPVKPKDGNLPKRPTDFGFPIRIKDPSFPTRRTAPTAPTPKSTKGFAFPFGWPNFSGRSGGGGVGYKGKPQSKRKFTVWDVRKDKIGFYGFGRKSDSYGGVFGELDALDKAAKAEKKTKSKEKKSGFDEVFNFNFDF